MARKAWSRAAPRPCPAPPRVRPRDDLVAGKVKVRQLVGFVVTVVVFVALLGKAPVALPFPPPQPPPPPPSRSAPAGGGFAPR